MRYRKLDADGDYSFGHGQADFHIDTPEAVGQAVLTRLRLYTGEWFLDTSEGTPWGGFPLNDLVVSQGRILGSHTQITRDLAIKMRILGTPGVSSIADYASSMNTARRFSVSCKLTTIYGEEQIDATFLPGVSGGFVTS